MSDDTDKCTRCGLCCHYFKCGTLVACKHLRGSLGNTSCAVYKDRLFRKIDTNTLCFPRCRSKIDYPDCPYNTDKPILRDYKDLVRFGKC